MTNVNTHILNQMCIVHLDISAWSGRSRLDKTDFIDQSQLPPETAVSLGSKKLINDKIISNFHRLRSASHRACEKLGVSFVGGYAIKIDDIDEVDRQLGEIKDEFNQSVETLVNNYVELTEEWIKENPGFEQQLRKALPSAETVARKFSYDFSIFQIESVPSHDMHKKANKLFDRVLDEVAETAKNYINTSLKGDTNHCSYITSRGRSILNTIQSRLRQLTFVSSEFGLVADWVEDLYNKLPAEGGIRGDDFRQFAMMLNTLANGDRIMEAAKLFADAPKDAGSTDLFMPFDTSVPSKEVSPEVSDDNKTDENVQAEKSAKAAQAEPSCEWGTSTTVPIEPKACKEEKPAEKPAEPETTEQVLGSEPEEDISKSSEEEKKPVVDKSPEIQEEPSEPTKRVVGSDFMPSIPNRKPKPAVSGEEAVASKPAYRPASFPGIEAANF